MPGRTSPATDREIVACHRCLQGASHFWPGAWPGILPGLPAVGCARVMGRLRGGTLAASVDHQALVARSRQPCSRGLNQATTSLDCPPRQLIGISPVALPRLCRSSRSLRANPNACKPVRQLCQGQQLAEEISSMIMALVGVYRHQLSRLLMDERKSGVCTLFAFCGFSGFASQCPGCWLNQLPESDGLVGG